MQQLGGSMNVCCINTRPYQAVQALKAHKSQYVWYDSEITAKLWAGVQHLQNALWLLCLQVSAIVYQTFLFHICEHNVQAGAIVAATTSM